MDITDLAVPRPPDRFLYPEGAVPCGDEAGASLERGPFVLCPACRRGLIVPVSMGKQEILAGHLASACDVRMAVQPGLPSLAELERMHVSNTSAFLVESGARDCVSHVHRSHLAVARVTEGAQVLGDLLLGASIGELVAENDRLGAEFRLASAQRRQRLEALLANLAE